jgi:hypothetical protein
MERIVFEESIPSPSVPLPPPVLSSFSIISTSSPNTYSLNFGEDANACPMANGTDATHNV